MPTRFLVSHISSEGSIFLHFFLLINGSHAHATSSIHIFLVLSIWSKIGLRALMSASLTPWCLPSCFHHSKHILYFFGLVWQLLFPILRLWLLPTLLKCYGVVLWTLPTSVFSMPTVLTNGFFPQVTVAVQRVYIFGISYSHWWGTLSNVLGSWPIPLISCLFAFCSFWSKWRASRQHSS